MSIPPEEVGAFLERAIARKMKMLFHLFLHEYMVESGMKESASSFKKESKIPEINPTLTGRVQSTFDKCWDMYISCHPQQRVKILPEKATSLEQDKEENNACNCNPGSEPIRVRRGRLPVQMCIVRKNCH